MHLVVGEEKDATEIEAEANVEVVSAQGTEFGLQGVTQKSQKWLVLQMRKARE